MRTAALAMGVAVLVAPAAAESQSAAPTLEGAWRVAQIIVGAEAGGGTVDAPQPGLLLFTDGYYSYTLVTGAEPRPPMPTGLPTAQALVAVWNPFTANAGTFEVSGSTMIRRPLVSKNPNAMGPGVFNQYTFRQSGDSLWITPTGTETGPTRGASTVKYVRVR